MSSGRPDQARGFTLVELVVVLALVAIVASVGFGRLADDTPIKARRFAADVASTLGSAQRLAMAQRRSIHVRIDTATRTVNLCLDAGCSVPIAAHPEQLNSLTAPSALSFSSSLSSISFDSRGMGSHNSALDLRVNNSSGSYLGHRILIAPGSSDVQLLQD